jgi:hypothetical protein
VLAGFYEKVERASAYRKVGFRLDVHEVLINFQSVQAFETIYGMNA